MTIIMVDWQGGLVQIANKLDPYAETMAGWLKRNPPVYLPVRRSKLLLGITLVPRRGLEP
jgi:hypothetical protein